MVEHQAGLVFDLTDVWNRPFKAVTVFLQRSEKVCLHATYPVACEDLISLGYFVGHQCF